MVKIKLNLFESIAGAIILPNIVFVLTTILFVISLFVKQDLNVYTTILISYIVNLFVMLFLIIVCILLNKKSKKEFILYDNELEFLDRKYSIDQIKYCEYYVCKWYALPFILVYKNQSAGLIIFKLNSGKKIQFRIFYKDYLKLKKKLPNIVEK